MNISKSRLFLTSSRRFVAELKPRFNFARLAESALQRDPPAAETTRRLRTRILAWVQLNEYGRVHIRTYAPTSSERVARIRTERVILHLHA